MKFIGITGGIGAGKTEILNYIRENYSCEICLADQAAHEVKRAGTACFKELVALLGEEVLGGDGEIDRQKMAAMIFARKELLEQVNHIVHPAVKKYLLERLEEAAGKEVKLFFVEAALLIETGYGELVDEMWYVYADEESRRKRLQTSRGYTEERIAHIMSNQLTEKEFRRASDFVIDNSGNLADTYRQIDKKLEAFTCQE